MSVLKKHFLLVLFLVVLFIVPVLGLFNRKTMNETENRMLNTFPVDAAGPREFLEGISLYLDDHFGLRDHFIELHRQINHQFGAQSARTKGIIVGKNEWMFYVKNVEIFEGEIDETEIEQLLSKIKAFRRSIDTIPIFIVIVPDKTFIYEEYLPDYIIKDNQRFEIIQTLKNVPGIHVLDLYDALRNEKKDTFLRYDTHWNGWGAYIAYQEIITFINDITGNMLPVNTEIETIKIDPNFSGNLARILGKKGELTETNNEVIFKESHVRETTKFWGKENSKIPDYFNPNGRGKAFLMHDSCSSFNLGRYLAETFNEMITLWSLDFEKAAGVIDETRPDFVLLEITDIHFKY